MTGQTRTDDVAHWDELDATKAVNETEAVASLLAHCPLDLSARAKISADAAELVRSTRAKAKRLGVVESFLQEFSLGTREGLALMCLAEALLRTPDAETRDRLIAEKIGPADWASHLGHSESIFVNASTWGLMLTGKLLDVEDEAKSNLSGYLMRLAGRVGEPVIRQAVGAAVGIMGEQFVLGRNIEAALKRADREGYLCSFDMLGEGARTTHDAERYERIYAAAIEAVGKGRGAAPPETGHGVSVKLSALCPRYEATHEARVWDELYPRIRRLALIAARFNMNFAIDAEEADRLVLSLKLVDRLAGEAELGAWTGLGVVVQAYQKRAPQVIARLADLSERTGRRLMVRLVKGAYWDAEIKKAQVLGRSDYPVWTTKPATDLAYLVCAKALIDASPNLYPQFATHNAHTLAAVRQMADQAGITIEHQRLHGMGEALYASAEAQYGKLTVRAYAPVGGHEDLLPYLVRRLLENGANTSFVHALTDDKVPAEQVVADPIAAVEAAPDRHPRLPIPAHIYGPSRLNSRGDDMSIATDRARLIQAAEALKSRPLTSGPIVGGEMLLEGEAEPRYSPNDRSLRIGSSHDASPEQMDRAFDLARKAQAPWDHAGGAARAQVLRAVADRMEDQSDRLCAIAVLEAGKTWPDAIAEVREAVDFCRYYAAEAERLFSTPTVLTGPVGEVNTHQLHGRGVFVCISPWNFPLAIFTGQVAAALAAGNAVLAKPAEQTPLIAAEAVKLFHAAGLDPNLLALLPGPGETVGASLTAHAVLSGVAFTGGTDTAWAINRTLAARRGPIVPFIAETGGLNGMFVDTTALKEQVVDDVIVSAFGSAGQRCSALRLLFLPQDTADGIIEGLKGAMDVLVVGDPADPAIDIGPVIDEAAKSALEQHLERLKLASAKVHRAAVKGSDSGLFFAPTLAELPDLGLLEREVFGPILHVVRYDPARLDETALSLAVKGYGLTLGIHSRLESFAAQVQALVPAGNVYVNRSIIGAVVGVQPFGGEGLSGTGPKAGGPYALIRYASERAVSVNIAAQGGDPALLNL
jgi:RHH-type proline utilization regulon transcriptional repressor/proline dehydrogenase/delta 1-pyrroline-5-carboxylate dehydrogenase